MQALESASERFGVSTDTLMENAGLACAQMIRHCIGGIAGRTVLVLVGPGNNGADGLVVARHLRRWGAEVCCYVVRGRPEVDPKMADALEWDVSVLDSQSDTGWRQLDLWLRRSSAVVDAILGAGRYRPLSGVVKDVVVRLNERRRANSALPIFAVDLPTGVNPDTGDADEYSVAADVCLALCFPKVGIASLPGAGFAGRVELLDIGLPAEAVEAFDLPMEWITGARAAELLPPRALDSHKGTYGHLLIVAGSRNYVGASVLAAQAAHRSGAGLVTLASPKSIHPIVAAKLTETIHLPLPEDAEGRVDAPAADVILEGIGGYSALAVGCGMGRSEGTAAFMERLLLHTDGEAMPTTVIDADGLNNLAACRDWSARLAPTAILTPHPGEMATLTGLSTREIQGDRMRAASEASAEWQQTVILKGAHSIVAAPNGRLGILPFANPALAAGGTGDALTGIVGGLLAQRLEPYPAALLGGYIHGAAADEVRSRLGVSGVIASDLLEWVPVVTQRLREGS